jgi:hypothetical protein
MVTGPADYLPETINNAQKSEFAMLTQRPMRHGSGVNFYRIEVRSVLRQAEDGSLGLRGTRRLDPVDSAIGRDSKSGAGSPSTGSGQRFVETHKLLLIR